MGISLDRTVFQHGIGNALCLAAFDGDVDQLVMLLNTSGQERFNGPPIIMPADPNTRGSLKARGEEFLATAGMAGDGISSHQATLLALNPTPLMIACFMGASKCVKELLCRPGIVLTGAVDLALKEDISLNGSKMKRDEEWQDETDACIELVRKAYWQRVRARALRVGMIALFVRRLFEEVHYRPGNRGAKRCRDEFEDASKASGSSTT